MAPANAYYLTSERRLSYLAATAVMRACGVHMTPLEPGEQPPTYNEYLMVPSPARVGPVVSGDSARRAFARFRSQVPGLNASVSLVPWQVSERERNRAAALGLLVVHTVPDLIDACRMAPGAIRPAVFEELERSDLSDSAKGLLHALQRETTDALVSEATRVVGEATKLGMLGPHEDQALNLVEKLLLIVEGGKA